MGARVIAVGEAVNDAERQVIAHLRDHGPDDWTVLHSLEIPRRGELFEVDLVVVTGHAVFAIDVKGTRGRIEVEGGRWCPAGRAPFRSPLPKLRGHAKQLKSLLQDADLRLSRVYTAALVVLSAPDAALIDRTADQRDEKATVILPDLIPRLADVSRVPTGTRPVDVDVSAHHSTIVTALTGTSRPQSGPLHFGSWEVIERLSESQRAPGIDVLDEYRARNAAAVRGSGTVRLSVRAADPYAPTAERALQQKKIGVAYEALGKLPAHPHIVGVRDFFSTEDESGWVTVYDDVPGHALRLHLSGSADALTADAKLRVIRHILLGLAHAHHRHITHRELSPATVLLAQDGRAMLTGFDYAKTAQKRGHTVMREARAAAELAYLAPECHADPTAMGPAADLYAVGVIAFELLAGSPPFASATEQADPGSRLPVSLLDQAGVGPELTHWLQLLCAADPAGRPPKAGEALRRFDLAVNAQSAPAKRTGGSAGAVPPQQPPASPPPGGGASSGEDAPRDANFFKNLPAESQFGTKFLVRNRMGLPGASGVAYKMYDTIRNLDRAVKLVLRDRHSPMEALQREFTALERLGADPHPNVVAVIDADRLPPPDLYPYIVFEYVEGKDVGEIIRSGRLGPEDVRRLAVDTARGLAHIHAHGVWHCDIKPSNLLWTDDGVKLIDFGISKMADSSPGHTGNTPRYLPPDLVDFPADGSAYTDRDLYALGITLYEALTQGQYPWQSTPNPPPGVRAVDPRELYSGFGNVAPGLVEILLKAISPYRSERFASAGDLLAALERLESVRVQQLRKPQPTLPAPVLQNEAKAEPEAPNTNPYVTHLQTLYSQSHRSNRGTRGLDPVGMQVYVATALDEKLLPALRDGKHALVVVTGNAGDGKTAFLERFEQQARDAGAIFGPPRPNGADFTLGKQEFRTNHDGSQDEEDNDSDLVLEEFFAPYAGEEESAWQVTGQTRLIAVNEGRLVDFLSHRLDRFPQLSTLVNAGLTGSATGDMVAVVNLNARDVTARVVDGDGNAQDGESILERMTDLMTREQFWDACASCDLVATCYARHNAQTFSHPVAGPQAKSRLRRIYELTRLRGQLHITLRDLRSALAYTLTSGRDCAEIHELYATGEAQPVIDSFYFSAFMGAPPTSEGTQVEQDRLLGLLRQVDVASVPQPQLDRKLDYTGLLDERAMVAVDGRGTRDRELLVAQFERLSRSASGSAEQRTAHRAYLDGVRRLLYFEAYDEERSEAMLPYRSALRFLDLLSSPVQAREAFPGLLAALNRGEGLAAPSRLGDALALQVREVPRGTVRSYRLFPADGFSLTAGQAGTSPYVESSRQSLMLRYRDPAVPGTELAELSIQLDLFELLERFAQGYRPTAADARGRQLALAVFKNALAAVPYQEVLLTTHGHDLHRIRRGENGVLHMEAVAGSVHVQEKEST
ncbi:protein kinase [Streptomyces anulatus]|uniref:methylation-associated defense system protein kinase MAD6 n=1 Tax=Streptomyces anulatus TaxID=1892 RepID=UPI002252AFBB|nr:serine/threonine protein kinase [Streptomyces anulatus]MCX4488866.1 protein kinase [Streptomyces anulatus]